MDILIGTPLAAFQELLTTFKRKKIKYKLHIIGLKNINIKASTYKPLISRVRGSYGKLSTEFFPSFYGPSAKRAGHENKEGKNEDP